MPAPYPFLDRNYEILSKVREGGMGAVYKVRHRLLDQTRIIKVIRPHLSGDARFGERFLREARAASRLRHPNIALLLDFSIDREGHEMLVMEYIDGLNLLEILERHGPPPLSLTLEIARQSLSALGYLHQQGIIHRDISPDNLMLTRDAEGRPLVKLIDLGIAKLQADDEQTLTDPGIFLGKPRYAAPEQFLEEGEVDARSDVYSLGVVLYELLTGHLPFAGKGYKEWKKAHLFHAPLTFAREGPEARIPVDLQRIVFIALKKDASQRFNEAQAMNHGLEEVARRFPVSPGEVSLVLGPPRRPESVERESKQVPSEATTHPMGPEAAPALLASAVSPAPAVEVRPSMADADDDATVSLRGAMAPTPPVKDTSVVQEAPAPEESPAAQAQSPIESRPKKVPSLRLSVAAAAVVLLLIELAGVRTWFSQQASFSNTVRPEDAWKHLPATEPGSSPPGEAAPAVSSSAMRTEPSAASFLAVEGENAGDGKIASRKLESSGPAMQHAAQERSIQSAAQEDLSEKSSAPETITPEPPPPMLDGPVTLLEKPVPVYPAEAIGSGRSYQITVRVTVGESGSVVGKPTVIGLIANQSSQEYGIPSKQRPQDELHRFFREAAIEAAAKARFNPRIQSGAPVQDKFVLVYDFAPP